MDINGIAGIVRKVCLHYRRRGLVMESRFMPVLLNIRTASFIVDVDIFFEVGDVVRVLVT